MRRLFPAIAGIALSAAAFAAPTPVGTWTGKIDFKFPPVPANATAQQKQQMAMAKTMISKMKFTLSVKADKTCSFTFTNPQTNKPMTQGGKWSQKGNVVTFVNSKGKDNQPMTATLSANGKSMTAIAPKNQGKIVFTKN